MLSDFTEESIKPETPQVIKKLTEREHILKRSGMYIGSKVESAVKMHILENNKFILKEAVFVPGLVKIFNELIDNSIDEYVRTEGAHASKIEIKVNHESFSVKDNGRGIPVTKVLIPEGEVYQPELAWTHARAGSNFENDNSSTIGTNGVGSMISSVFSKDFLGVTNDGKLKCTVHCQKNNEIINTSVVKSSGARGTEVSIVPDIARFGLDSITDNHIKMIEQRIHNLSVAYPGIAFKFNNKRILLKPKHYIEMFGNSNSEGTLETFKDFSLGFFNSKVDEFQHFTLMNGLSLTSGGTQIDYISNIIVSKLKDKITRKYKDIKAGDIKQKLFLVLVMNDFKGPQYETQTKEKLTNPTKDISAYFKELDLDKLAEKIFRNKNIIEPIIDYYRIKEEFKKKQDLKKLDVTKKKIKSDKYIRPIGENNILILCEGASARGGLMPILGRKGIGYYELKGKPLNAYSSDHKKFIANKELSELYQIIQKEGYKKVLTGTDQDLDGIQIAALLIGFYKKYLPEDLKNGKLGRLQTPVFFTRKGKVPDKWFYKLRDIPNEKGEYMKGLGSWIPSDLKYIINKDGLNSMAEMLEDDSDEVIEQWLGNDSAPRKQYIINNDFDLIKL